MRGRLPYPAVSSRVVFHHPSSLEHETGEHPEQARRLEVVHESAQEAEGWELMESPEAAARQVEAVHPERYMRAIHEACMSGGRALDPDTLVSEGSWEAAMHAAGGALAVVAPLLGGGAEAAFSPHRPPGHHAETAAVMGFLDQGNVAVAARHAQA